MKNILYQLTIFFSSLVGFFFNRSHLHTARFASLSELSSLTSPIPEPESILLGRTHFNQILRVRSTPKRRELGNVLVVAPTRGGKGLLATSQLLSWRHSVIVNDIKGELFTQTAGYRATLGNVYVIDPEGFGHRYDPLNGRLTEDQLLSAATNLLFHADEGEGAIFTQRATKMLKQLFLAARQEDQPPLPYVRNAVWSGLPQAVQLLHAVSPVLATRFLEVPFESANFQDRFLLSAWGTLTTRLEPILTETVIRCFTHTDFTTSELLKSDKPVTVYLRWPERDLLALSPLVRLMWGSFIDELITVYDKANGQDCKPVLLLIDEAGRTALPMLAEHATTVVGRGISLWIAIQDLSQLETLYGSYRARTLRNNCETQLYYRPNDQETADYLEHCLGKRSAYAQSHTLRNGQETSEGQSEQGIPLLTAQEIRLFYDEQIIGFHRRLRPFRASRMDWRDTELLRLRHGLPSPKLSLLPGIEDEKLPNGHRRDVFTLFINPDIQGN